MECNSVTCLMVGCQLFLPFGHYLGLLFCTNNNLDCSLFNLLHCNSLKVLSGGKECCLVKEVLKVCTCKAGCGLGNIFKVNIGGKWLFPCVNTKYCLTTCNIRVGNYNLSVKTTGTHKSRVKNIRSVCGGNEDYTVVCTKAVHLNK